MNIIKPVILSIIIAILCGNCSNDMKLPNRTQDTSPDLQNNIPRPADACPDRLRFKYSYILSYPRGGGVFIVGNLDYITGPGNNQDDYSINLHGDPDLNLELITNFPKPDYGIAEISINPTEDIDTGRHFIQVMINQNDVNYRFELEVEIIPLTGNGDSLATVKRNEFSGWLSANYPELGDLESMAGHSYITYPGIWIVEHWTFLNELYEFRVCWHVMIPPYDWSMICIRRRGQWEPLLAAMRDTSGRIFEIPIDEYPTFYGY